jgi:hypothetical protein
MIDCNQSSFLDSFLISQVFNYNPFTLFTYSILHKVFLPGIGLGHYQLIAMNAKPSRIIAIIPINLNHQIHLCSWQQQLSLHHTRWVNSPLQGSAILCPRLQDRQESESLSPQAIVSKGNTILHQYHPDQHESGTRSPQAIIQMGRVFLHLNARPTSTYHLHKKPQDTDFSGPLFQWNLNLEHPTRGCAARQSWMDYCPRSARWGADVVICDPQTKMNSKRQWMKLPHAKKLTPLGKVELRVFTQSRGTPEQ